MTSSSQAAPRIAVVIPCFNDGKTLPEAVESARAQEACEVVVVDDGSSEPGTIEILRRLEDAGVRVVHQENKGLALARMTGVAATAARYVYPLDADDRLVPGVLSKLADALDADPDSAVAWGNVRMFGDVDYLWPRSGHLDPWRIIHVNPLPMSSLIRRSSLLEAGGWELRGGYEDWDLWMAFAERGFKGVYVPELMLLYRIHGQRMFVDAAGRHDRIYAELRRRHPSLWQHRFRKWLRSPSRWRLKLTYPVIAALPFLSLSNKRRLFHFVVHPGNVTRAGLRRLRSRRS
jgi:glycosyltransferase involved in cell wall biosynthesis